MIRRTTIAIVGAAFVGLVAGLVLSWRASIAPIERPAPEKFSADSVAHGEALAAAGHCASCHSRPGGEQFAGGYGVNTPFGIIFGTNITPEPRTGIGTWSLAAFARAMRQGVARDGSHLFPAFPYYAYTKLSDALGRSQDTIVLRSYLLGGGFGRRLDGDYTVPAALAAKAIGKPVKMGCTRADAMPFDCPRSPSTQVLRMSWGDGGRVTAM